ncbi:hypothetical protein [Bradyrhizobium sp. CCBAU 51753]|uniref:hypothetical protein n=1 Tax=Bradyrhizobium sp. CCBAU 51753 TaxID=1325100 RepID=UPI00188D51FF|nr:hypothetical protein [Bradyrhizobium sp. CCBAU 51753]QOZ25291.1 hypothetical protein XH93_18110 [Bradyrhizobium sp. CCBAU 51753]
MASIKYWLPAFDPSADFVVAAWPLGFSIGGYQPKPGEPFDKTAIKRRNVLEELYAKRWIAVAEKHVTPPPPAPRPIEPDDDGDEIDDDWKDLVAALPGLVPEPPPQTTRRRRNAQACA